MGFFWRRIKGSRRQGYSDLEDNARERLALNQFLAQITNPQIAFGVKQKRPKTVEEAAVTTIELESYLGSTGERLHVNSTFPQPDSEQAAVGSATAVAAVSPRATDNSRDGEGLHGRNSEGTERAVTPFGASGGERQEA